MRLPAIDPNNVWLDAVCVLSAQMRGVQDWIGDHNHRICDSVFVRCGFELASTLNIEHIKAWDLLRFIERFASMCDSKRHSSVLVTP